MSVKENKMLSELQQSLKCYFGYQKEHELEMFSAFSDVI